MLLESTIFLHDPEKEDDFYIKNSYFVHDWVGENCTFLRQSSDEIDYSVTQDDLIKLQNTINELLNHLRYTFDALMYTDFESINDFEDQRDAYKTHCSVIANVTIRDNIDIDFYNKLSYINEMVTTLINKNKAKMIYTYRGNI